MPANVGSQTIDVKYHDPVDSIKIDRRFHGIRPPGMYWGGHVTNMTSSGVTFSKLILEIKDANGTHSQIRMETDSDITLTYAGAGWGSDAKYVVARWTLSGDPDAENIDYVDFVCTNSPQKFDVILFYSDWTNPSTPVADYSLRTHAHDISNFCKVVPLYPTPSASVVNVLPGMLRTATGYVQITDQMSQSGIDLSSYGTGNIFIYLTAAGNIGTASALTSCTSHVLLARVTKSAVAIEEDSILDLRNFLTYPTLVDDTTIEINSTGELALKQANGKMFVPALKHIYYANLKYGIQTGLDLAALSGSAVPTNATHVMMRGHFDLNMDSGENTQLWMYMDAYPSGGDFTGFNNDETLKFYVDGHGDKSKEAQSASSFIIPLAANAPELGMWVYRSGDSPDSALVHVWIEGYYV